jgi:ABC-type transport system involved in cytochrome c biogenesis permease subunit
MSAALRWLLAAALVLLGALEARAQSERWTPRAADLAGGLPVQEGGRIKPLDTFAGFTLLRLNGQRSAVDADGRKLTPIEWLLDALFDPEHAARTRSFLVPDVDAVTAIGLDAGDKRKRDRYSFRELEPGLPKLFELAHQYEALDPALRSSLQQQVVTLAENVMLFIRITRQELVAIVPPPSANLEAWSTPAELRARENSLSTAEKGAFDAFRSAEAVFAQPVEFEAALARLHTQLLVGARLRGEYAKVSSERSYYRANLLRWSLVGFVLAFLVTAALWLAPRKRWLYGASVALTSLAAAVLVAAIVWRCILRERPPVTTLYETKLFVTAVGVVVALAIEAIGRKRIALSAAATLGLLGVFVANSYELLDKRDTMPALVAVLDTNFWLATHVTAITIGYAAGMLAALLASGYLLAKLLRVRRADRAFYASLSRMVYGVLCFGLLFSLVGTLLGGIWANESWGRFWGWDPKENGALLIVISQLVILHARRGGYLREHGVCMAAAFAGTIVAFSWWGVNLLGVGLHSYGFTSGIRTALWSYYAAQWTICGLGAVAWLLERGARTDATVSESETTPEAEASGRREAA